jgi:hypothetical protein
LRTGYRITNYTEYNVQVKSFLDYSNTIYVARAIDRDGSANKEDTTYELTADVEIGDEVVGLSATTNLFVGENISFDSDTTVYEIVEIDGLDVTIAPSATSAYSTDMKVYECKPSANAAVDVLKKGSVATITPLAMKATIGTYANFPEYEAKIDVVKMASADSSLKFIAKDVGFIGNSYSVVIAGKDEFTDVAEAVSGVNLAGLFEYAPSTSSQFAVMVVDDTQGGIVEKFLVSTDPTEKDFNNKTMYIEEIINRQSAYVNCKHVEGTVPETALISNVCRKYDLAYGEDGVIGKSEVMEQFENNFADKETIDIDIVIIPEIAHKEIADFCKTRADVVGYFGARFEDVVGVKPTVAVNNLVKYITQELNIDNKYVSFIGNYAYIYDRWSDKNRWINIAGMVAGLRAQTNNQKDVFYAEAGLNNGQLKNVVKIAQSFTLGQRDLLYKNSINCVVSFPGLGSCLYGQKTTTQKPSNFSRVNVRSLFNYIERAISKTARWVVFEQNTETTRNLFVSMTKPFIERLVAAGGISEFVIVCDSSNNTPQVLASNGFVADFYIKNTATAEFLQLNFISVGQTIQMSEVVGKV